MNKDKKEIDKRLKKLNNVTKKEVIDAMEYFFKEGFIDELTPDKYYYTKILLNKVANDYKIKLNWGDE